MALDINFPSPQEEFERLKSKGLAGTPPPLSMDVPGVIQDAMKETDFQPFQKPFQETREAPKPQGPGFLKEFGHVIAEDEVATHSVNYLWDKHKLNQELASNEPGQENPKDTSTPDGWTPYQIDVLERFPEQWRPYLVDSENPAQYQYRQREVENIIKRDEMYENGSTLGWAAGKVAAFGIDAALMTAIPIASSLKYATWSGAIFKNLVRQAPGITAASVAYTAAMDSTTTGKTMQDFAKDTFVNTMAGLALTGFAGGLGKAFRGGELYEASRNIFKGNLDGVELKYEVNDKNIITGMKAVDAETGQNLSAARLDPLKEAMDSFYNKSGIFKLPYAGKGIEKAIAKASPVFRGVTSEWLTVNKLTNIMADHSIETVGTANGKARQQSFESFLRGVQTDAIRAGVTVEGYRAHANGFEIGNDPISGIKRLKQRMTQGVAFSKESFSDAITNTLITGNKHENTAVNEASEFVRNFYQKHLEAYQEAHGLEVGTWNVRTAENYISRMYDVNYMLKNRDSWMRMSYAWFNKQNEIVNTLRGPVDEAMQRVTDIKSLIHNGVDVEQNRLLLNQAKKAHKAAKERLRNEVTKDDTHHIHLDEIPLSKQEIKSLNSVTKKWKDAQKEHKNARARLTSLKNKTTALKSKFETGEKIINPESKDYAAIKAEIESNNKAQMALEEEVQAFEKKAYDEHEAILQRVREGEVPRSLYVVNEETGAISFKKPNAPIKFVPLNQTEDEMHQAALGYFNSITSLDADKLAERMLQGMHGATTGSPILSRSFMIPDSYLYDEKFLLKDITRNMATYALTLGRKTHLTNTLKDFYPGMSGTRGIAEHLLQERNQKEKVLEKIKDKAKRDKAIMKLHKSYSKAEGFINSMLKVSEGKWGVTAENETARQIARGARAFVATTKLGNVPIAMIPDMAANIIKHGPWRSMRDHIIPFVKSINGLIKTEEYKHLSKSAEESGLALESVINSHADSMFNNQVLNQMTVPGKVVGGLEYTAKLAGNLSLTNFAENMNQKYSASIAESRILEAMHKFQKGTLGKRELKYLSQLGIDPQVWSNRFVDSFKSGESHTAKLGSMRSKWWDWEDLGARNKMADAIRDTVSGTVIRRGMYDSPFIANDPMTSLVFNLTGWLFASLNRYAIPMLQNPSDSYLMIGLIAQIGLGALVDPLRKWSRGEGFEIDEDKWFGSAVSNSTPFASIYNAAMWGNAITGNQFLDDMKNDRKRQLNFLGSMAGPAFGSAENIYRIGRMVASGKYNRQDMKLLANSIPMTNMWYTNAFKNEMMDNLTSGLPKNYNKAQGYFE